MDTINPDYYSAGGIAAIAVIESFDLGFNLGNSVKYILRAGKKENAVDDLNKAIWYLQREINMETHKNQNLICSK